MRQKFREFYSAVSYLDCDPGSLCSCQAMNLQELNGGTPSTKPWLNIKANSVETKTATVGILTVDDVVVDDLSANLLTLNDTASVPNPPLGAVSFYSTGTNFKATNPLGATVTFATTSFVGGYLPLDGSQAMTGNLNLGGSGIVTNTSRNIRIGNGAAISAGTNSIAIGTDATSRDGGTAVGSFAVAANGVAIGENAATAGNSSTAVGNDAVASGLGGTSIGRFATTSVNNCLAVGINATCDAVSGIAVGRNANCPGESGVALGSFSTASGLYTIAIGDTAAAAGGIAIGANSSCDGVDAIAIGPTSANADTNTCSIGNVSISNVRPGNDGACDLGTSANRFRDLFLSAGVHGPLSVGSNYSIYDNTTCNNTVAETDISTTASSVGSLELPAGQPLGMVFELNLAMAATSAAGDTLAISYYAGGGVLFAHNLTIPALSVSLPVSIKSVVVVRDGTANVYSTSLVGATSASIVSNPAYDRTSANTWSITAQWGANVNQLAVGQLYAKSFFRG